MIVIKARRGHLDAITRGPNGTFSSSGGRGSQGGNYSKGDDRVEDENDKKKPDGKKKPKGDDDDKKPPGKGGKVGPVRWLTRTEQMHRPVPRKPIKPRYGGTKKPGPAAPGEGR